MIALLRHAGMVSSFTVALKIFRRHKPAWRKCHHKWCDKVRHHLRHMLPSIEVFVFTVINVSRTKSFVIGIFNGDLFLTGDAVEFMTQKPLTCWGTQNWCGWGSSFLRCGHLIVVHTHWVYTHEGYESETSHALWTFHPPTLIVVDTCSLTWFLTSFLIVFFSSSQTAHLTLAFQSLSIPSRQTCWFYQAALAAHP